MRIWIVSLILVLSVLGVAVLRVERSNAAVRLCKAHVTSKVTSATSERAARRMAIRDWTEKAKASGIAHPSWRIANFKVVRCVPWAGRFECVAHAAPCTIKQKMPKSPKRKRRKERDEALIEA